MNTLIPRPAPIRVRRGTKEEQNYCVMCLDYGFNKEIALVGWLVGWVGGWLVGLLACVLIVCAWMMIDSLIEGMIVDHKEAEGERYDGR